MRKGCAKTWEFARCLKTRLCRHVRQCDYLIGEIGQEAKECNRKENPLQEKRNPEWKSTPH